MELDNFYKAKSDDPSEEKNVLLIKITHTCALLFICSLRKMRSFASFSFLFSTVQKNGTKCKPVINLVIKDKYCLCGEL